MMAVLLAVVQPADAPPDDLPLPSGRPCAAAVGRAAFAADQQLRQRVFAAILALLGFGADLLDLLLAAPPCQFLLHAREHSGVNDRRMIVFHIKFLPLAAVGLDTLGQAVLHIGLAQNCERIERIVVSRHASFPPGEGTRCASRWTAMSCRLSPARKRP